MIVTLETSGKRKKMSLYGKGAEKGGMETSGGVKWQAILLTIVENRIRR